MNIYSMPLEHVIGALAIAFGAYALIWIGRYVFRHVRYARLLRRRVDTSDIPEVTEERFKSARLVEPKR